MPCESHKAFLVDLLDRDIDLSSMKYDFVYSIGLIEHFVGDDIGEVINKHFSCCSENGIVMISFPTPTFKYILIRKLMEAVNKWQFYDEIPLRWEEVKKYFEANGEVKTHFINRKLPLTQMIVVTKKRSQDYV